MPEIRYNPITRQWVIVATDRARRPDQFRQEEPKPRTERLARVADCPFCPGNEAQTPPHTFREPSTGDWRVRVVPNKFPALTAEGPLERVSRGLKRWVSGVGRHEVIIETPEHDRTLARLEEPEVERVLRTMLLRFQAAQDDPRVAQVTLFKNHGARAGTSLEHPHAQLIATPVIPSEVHDRLETALAFYEATGGECLFCKTLEDERREGARTVLESDHFLAFVPFAALSPFHTWLFPKRHAASFSQTEPAALRDLARVLRGLLRKLYDGLGDPDYNFVIRAAPKDSERVRYYHWYLSVVPRVSTLAGFELGSGMFINTALPEDSARFLRSIDPA